MERPPVAVTVRFEQSGLRRGRAALERATVALLDRALENLGWAGAEVTVLFCSDERIRALNSQFRGIDSPTDVLSFPGSDNLEAIQTEAEPYLGDLAIALGYTSQQGRPLDEEVPLLLVHGLLHLLGRDHDTAEKRRAMQREEHRLLALGAEIEWPAVEPKGAS